MKIPMLGISLNHCLVSLFVIFLLHLLPSQAKYSFGCLVLCGGRNKSDQADLVGQHRYRRCKWKDTDLLLSDYSPLDGLQPNGVILATSAAFTRPVCHANHWQVVTKDCAGRLLFAGSIWFYSRIHFQACLVSIVHMSFCIFSGEKCIHIISCKHGMHFQFHFWLLMGGRSTAWCQYSIAHSTVVGHACVQGGWFC